MGVSRPTKDGLAFTTGPGGPKTHWAPDKYYLPRVSDKSSVRHPLWASNPGQSYQTLSSNRLATVRTSQTHRSGGVPLGLPRGLPLGLLDPEPESCGGWGGQGSWVEAWSRAVSLGAISSQLAQTICCKLWGRLEVGIKGLNKKF